MRFLTLIFLLSLPAHSESLQGNWSLEQSTLTYHVKYVLKKVEGVSHGAKGKGQCELDQCKFLVAVPVKDFDSGDTNRDMHMLEVTKGALNPMVMVELNLKGKTLAGSFASDIDVQFAGQKHQYKAVKINVALEGDKAKATGDIPLVLTDFAIQRPTLLGVAIEDATPVHFETVWSKAK